MKKLLLIGVCVMMILPQTVFSQSVDIQLLNLKKMFELADSNNLSIKAYAKAVEVSEASVKTAKNALMPKIDLSLSLAYNGNGVVVDRDFSNPILAAIPPFGNNFALEVSQVIFSGGAIKNGIKISELSAQLASLEAEDNRQNIRFLLVGHYLEMCKLENQILVFDTHIAQTEKMLENMRSQYKEGTAIQNDITRYELQLQNLKYTRIQLQNSVLIIKNQLKTYLRLPMQTQIVLDTNDLYSQSTINTQSQWETMAFETALSLKSAEVGVKINEYKEKLAHADRYPQIGFYAAEHLDGPITIDIPAVNKNFNYWYLGLGIRYKLDNLYKTGREIKVSRLQLQQANANLAVAEESIQMAVESAYIRYNESYVLLETKQKSVDLARQNYEVISDRYDNDLALITDLLDASSQKLDAELQVVNARINISYNYYKLKYIAGNL